MATFTDAQIAEAFRAAGFEYGTPVTAQPDDAYTPPDDYAVIKRMFPASVITGLSALIADGDGEVDFLAAELLAYITRAGYTVTGRPIALTSYNLGQVSLGYPTATEYRANARRAIAALRAKGRLAED